jgi:erythrin-vacuolar iron transport family protein
MPPSDATAILFRSNSIREERTMEPLLFADAELVARGSAIATTAGPSPDSATSFLLQRVQPAMTGLIDGSLSTLAPIFTVALATHQPRYAFFAGLATAIGAGVSMAFSEGLSDTGELTGRGNAYLRGSITGAGTFLGGILHTLPFLIPQYRTALIVAVAVVVCELLALAWIRSRFFRTGFLGSFVSVTLGGAIIVALSAALGAAAG